MATAAIIAAPAAPVSSRLLLRTGTPTQAEDLPQLWRTNGSAGEAKLGGHRPTHRLIAVAGGKADPFNNGAHHVAKAMTVAQANKAGAGFGVDERPAFARFGDIGVIEQRAGFGLAEPAVDVLHQSGMIDLAAEAVQQVAGDM